MAALPPPAGGWIPPQAFLTFADSPAPYDLWIVGMPADPLLEVNADDAFAALFHCFDWTPHPPAPAIPTHLRCKYSWVHLLLHSCVTAEEDALLDSPFLARYTLPSKLAAIWLAIAPQVEQHTPFTSVAIAWKACRAAALTCNPTDELRLTLADTAFAQPAPVAGILAARWPLFMTTREVNLAPQTSLFGEAWLLWRFKRRFTNAARSDPANPLYILLESARVHVLDQSPLLAPFLALTAPNIGNIAGPVGAHIQLWTLPIEMIKFPSSSFGDLVDASRVHDYLFGEDSLRQIAFVERLPLILEHFPAVFHILLRNEEQPDLSARKQRLAQLTAAYFPALQDAFNVNLIAALEARVLDVSAQMELEADQPNSPTARVLYHCAQQERLKRADKELSKAAATPSVASKIAGVQTTEFREASAALSALLADGMADPNEVLQTTFKHLCKLLSLHVLNMCSGVSGFPIFASLSPYRNHFPEYVAWALSTDDTGVMPRKSKGRLPPESFVKALLQGLWGQQLDLYNLAMIWEQMMAGRAQAAVPEHLWYLDPTQLRVMLKLGLRLFEAISRSGGDELTVGSFSWVMQQGLALLESRNTRSCQPLEIDEMVAWWFRAALSEAGTTFRDETKADTDFSKPLLDIFIHDSGRGCIAQLNGKLASLDKWEMLADDLPHTLGAILNGDNTTMRAHSAHSMASSLSTFMDPVVRASAPSQPGMGPPPAPPGSQSHVSTAQTIASLEAEVRRLSSTPKGKGAPTGKGTPKGKGSSKGKGASSSQGTPPNNSVVFGSDSNMVAYKDLNGVTQSDDSLNVMLHVTFRAHEKKALRAALDQEFGVHLCKPPLFSNLFGKSRFTLCDNPAHPDHATANSVAHRYPRDARQRLERHFR
jgi:hypothetical protein